MKPSILNHALKYKKTNQYNQGFTLIELMVVIAIFVSLMAIAIPNFQNMVYGSASERAVMELRSVLQNARLKAIKTHGTATVLFNTPAANQLRVQWTENGVNRTRDYNLSPNPGRVTFDPAPPGVGAAPDGSFVFSELGFIQPAGGGTTSNIYVIDNNNLRRFHIGATLAGGIVEREWNGTSWPGPPL